MSIFFATRRNYTNALCQIQQHTVKKSKSLKCKRLHTSCIHRQKQINGPVRVRFAPSPTGYLHLGGLRTALFNYLTAKKYGGAFILRIEDTDSKRFVKGATESIIKMLDWAGIRYDEGPGRENSAKGPYFQSQRTDLYRHYTQNLLKNGHAYPCFCKASDLESMRQLAQKRGLPPRYDQRCLNLSQAQVQAKMQTGEPYVIRFRSPDSPISVNDMVYGNIQMKASSLDDAVLLKSDGLPTYHLANVVDDHHMDITHVMRGEEWLVSTPKHLALFKALGWDAPEYIHLPLLLNSDGAKLSKRHGGHADVSSLVKDGYLPEAVVNFVAFLGWNPKTTEEIFTIDSLIDKFSVNGLNRGNPVVNIEKLRWLNKQHLRSRLETNTNVAELVEQARNAIVDQIGTKDRRLEDEKIMQALKLAKDKLVLPSDIVKEAGFLFNNPDLGSDESLKIIQQIPPGHCKKIAEIAIKELEKMDPHLFAHKSQDCMPFLIERSMKETGLKKGQVMKAIRWALTGQKDGPKIPQLLSELGHELVIKRLLIAAQFNFPK
ncbi:Glutamate--tRNA ligase mitochondrial [Mycoemilia scoparia]|uniref:Glutamate--tRNA ligase, mitochondrial n=1 Tax=Mycoemilia scoparia TaxID=417184 RepID=A0A9W8AAV8_9FUNG|nr:Glutamate--tRNA ligase mitochondrial [Mycoemilia scoparia]